MAAAAPAETPSPAPPKPTLTPSPSTRSSSAWSWSNDAMLKFSSALLVLALACRATPEERSPTPTEAAPAGRGADRRSSPNEASPNEASPNEASPNEASPNEASPNEATRSSPTSEGLSRARATLERGELAPVDRVGFFTDRLWHADDPPPENAEAHLCGTGVTALTRDLVAEQLEMGWFDECSRAEDELHCAVFGEGTRTIFTFTTGPEGLALRSVANLLATGMLADEAAAAAHAEDFAAFQTRVRRAQTRRQGHPWNLPRTLPPDVAHCR